MNVIGRLMTTKRTGFLLSILTVLIGLLSIRVSYAQVVIPRDGFPYCEPFTNSSVRPNTVFDGFPNKAVLTGGASDPSGSGVLQLTPDDFDQRGWVYVDLPFSSAYGIKASFEYFAYGSSSINQKADGFSFFLFDGNIDQTNFKIGGLGGSLGYSPLRYSTDNTFLGGYGLKGAYMGIGLDSRGNWANHYEGRYGGFTQVPPAPFAYGSGLAAASFPKYPNSIAIRGPVDSSDSQRDNGMTGMGAGTPSTFPQPAPGYRSYPFIDGKILNNDPSDGGAFAGLNPSFFLPSNQRFTIASASNSRITNCATDGYRKVFIDLKPDGAGAFTVSMSMLVTINGGIQQVVPIFSNVPYPFPSPQNLKVGFAAATGNYKNKHEIRNVTVEVSSIDPTLAPNPPVLDETVCFNENLTFDFNVSLPAQNQFIRCLQLYPVDPGPPNNAPNPNGDPTVGNCGLSGVCNEKCKPENKTIAVPGVGTFESILEDLTDQNFGNERSEAKIKFTPVPGFFGTHTIYYTVIDNYGLTSEAKTVTVTVNPFPKIDPTYTVIGPTCNGQNDGTISNAVLKELIPGYSFTWADASGNVLPASSYTVTETTVNGYIQATVGVTGVNLGKYYLTVNNPASNSACDDTFEFEVKDVRGTPVDVVLDDQEICEGTAVIFTPQLEDPTDANNPTFVWWKDNNKTQPITNSTVAGVTYQIAAPGVLTITGLPQSATPYEYYVEVKADPLQNLCATPAGGLRKVEVLVLPPLDFSAVKNSDDWCLSSEGQIQASVNNPTSTITFTLVDDGGNVISTNPTGTFSGLDRGDYEVFAESSSPLCISVSIPIKIEGPAGSLALEPVATSPEYCDLENGSLEFSLSGGNTPYSSITVGGLDINSLTFTVTGSNYVVTGLPGGTYPIEVLDARNCPISISMDVPYEAPSLYETTDEEICEGQSATIQAIIVNQSTSTPSFAWFAPNGSGGYLPITDGGTIDGATFTINTATRELTVSGLAPSNTPYTFYLQVSGPKVCDQGYIPAEILVNFGPEMNPPVIALVDCFGAANGSIQAAIPSGNLSDFQFSLIGDNGYNAPFASNSGLFQKLAPGTYQLFIQSQDGCESSLSDLEITEPTQLVLTELSKVEPTCGDDNGSWIFEISGGNPDASGNYSMTLDGTSFASLGADLVVNSPGNFTISNLNPGAHLVKAVDANNCQIELSVNLTAQPIPEFDVQDEVICEGENATLVPQIVDQAGSTPVFAWSYENPASPGVFIPISSGDQVGDLTFTVSNGELTIAGLVYQAAPYVYYMGVSGALVCPEAPIPAEVQVLKIPEATFETVLVSCFGESDGEIRLISSDPAANMIYTLIETGASNATGNFGGLAFGAYTIEVQEQNSPCSNSFTVTVDQPDVLLVVNGDSQNPTCGEDNGIWTFGVTGGTPDVSGNYVMTLDGASFASLGADVVSNSPGNFTISNLSPGVHLVKAVDANDCEAELSLDLIAQPIPQFAVQDLVICQGINATLIPQIVDQAGSIPAFAWSYEDSANPGTYIPINSGDQVGDLTFTISNDELTIAGLVYQVAPYVYYMSVSGALVCPEAPIPAEVQVLKIPEATFESVSVSCFGENDGQINLISSDPATNITYSLVETGASNATGNFAGLTPGTYTIEVQEQNSPCSNSFSVVVGQPDELLLINEDSQNPTCGDDNGSISFELTGGTQDYTVLINGNPLSAYISSQVGGLIEVKNLAAGNYSVQVNDANSCSLTRTNLFVLVNDAGVDVAVDPMELETCEGMVANLLPVFQNTLPVTPNFNWYKDAGLTQPVISSATPDAQGVIYQINSSTGRLTITGLPANSYSYYLEISGPGICTAVTDAEVVVIPAIVSVITLSHETCFGAADGSITLNSSGGNGVFEYSFNGGAFGTTDTFGNLAPGTYTISVRNDLGCLETQSAEILGASGPIQINTPDLIRSSCDLDNGSIENLVISGGWGDYIVEWRKDTATGGIIPGDVAGAADLAPGTYFLLVTDKEGCKATFSFSIEESSDPVYAVVPPIDSCTGTPVTIRPVHIAPNPSLPPAAATEVRWYTGPGQTGLIVDGSTDPAIPSVTYSIDDSDWLNPELEVNGLPAGSYDYYFYVVCTGQEIKIEVTVYDTPAAILEIQPITCFGDTNGKVKVTAGSNPTYTYSLNGGSPMNQAALEALNLGAGTYDLEIATPAGCSQNLTFEVEGPSAALQSSPLTKIDPGCGSPNGKLEVTITGGWVPYTLEVFKNGVSQGTQSTSDSDISLNGYTPGTYHLQLTDKEGCTVTTNSVILVDGPSQVLVDDEEICEGGVATLVPELDPSAPGATFQWYFNAALTQAITSSPSPAADGNIYQISPSTGILSITNLQTKATPYTYYVTASGGGVCPGFVGQVNVLVSDSPSATATVENEICFGEGGEIEILATGGSGNYTYSLNGGAFGTSNVFQVATGTYQVEVQTSAGCSFVLNNIVVSGPSGKLTADNMEQDNPSCDLDNGEIRFNVMGGYEPYVVTIVKNGVNSGTQTLAAAGQIKFSNLGIGEYAFLINDAQGCQIALPNSITLIEQPTVIQANDDTICEGEVAELIPSVPQNIVNPQFSWYFDSNGSNLISSGTSNGLTYTVDPNGKLTIAGLTADQSPVTYYVIAAGTGICGVELKPVKVTVNQIATLRVSNPSVVCNPNGTVDLTEYIEGFNPGVYDYNVLSPSGTAMQLGQLETVAVSGDYRVSSSTKGSNCWNAAQRIRVLISEELLVADFEFEVDLGNGNLITGGDIQIEENVLFKDLSLGKAILWNWDFGDGATSSDQNPVHQYLEKGTYTVKLQVIDDIGCVSNFEITVNVFDDYLVMIPNAFTPDGLKNQFFKPQFRGIASMEFYIFNTWGELIFQSASIETQGWDGTLNGQLAPNGNYVYRAIFETRSGEKIEKSGVFILIR